MGNFQLDVGTVKLLIENPKLKKDVDFFIDENTNVNPDELKITEEWVSAAIKCMVIALQGGLIKGPYNKLHFNHIKEHLIYPAIQQSDFNEFWNLFSFHCASTRVENKHHSLEFLSMQGLYDILAINADYANLDKSAGLQVANLNTGKIETLKPKGVLTRF